MIIDALICYIKLLLTQYCPTCKGVGRIEILCSISLFPCDKNHSHTTRVCESCCGAHYPSDIITEFNRVRKLLKDLGIKVNDSATIIW